MKPTAPPSSRTNRGERAPRTRPAGDAGRVRVGAPEPQRPDAVRLPVLVVCLAALAASSNTLWNGFVYDDTLQVLQNPWLKDLRHLREVFAQSVWSFQTDEVVSNYYRPVMYVVYMVTARVFGLQPWAFHLVNLLLHAGVTALVFLVARQLFDRFGAVRSPWWRSEPFLAAILFATHPIHTEVVAWVACVPELSFALLTLASFHLYIARERDFTLRHWSSVLLFFLGTLCKETALTLPALLIVYDWVGRAKDRFRPSAAARYLPYAVVAGIYLVLRLRALGGMAPEERHAQLTAYEYAINALPLFAGYLEKLLVPLGLNAFHVFHPIRSILEVRGLVSAAVTAAFGASCVLAWRKSPLAVLAIAFLTFPLLPVLYVPAVGQNTFAERYLYLPSFGFVLLVALALGKLGATARGQRATVALSVLLTGVYCIGTMQRNRVWSDDLVLYEDTLSKSPDATLMMYNYGNALMDRGQLAKAAQKYEAALAQQPGFLSALVNLGAVRARTGNLDEAIRHLEQAVAQAPNVPDARRNLGIAYGEIGRLAESLEQFDIVARLRPDSARAHNDLGMAFANLGRMDEAIAHYDRALAIDPDHADAHYNRGLALERKGLPAKAEVEYARALAIDPAMAEAHFSLGALFAASGRDDDAVVRLEQAVRLEPEKAAWHNLLGIEYGKKGIAAAAAREFEAAVRLNPAEPAYRQNLERAQALRDTPSAPATPPGTAGGS